MTQHSPVDVVVLRARHDGSSVGARCADNFDWRTTIGELMIGGVGVVGWEGEATYHFMGCSTNTVANYATNSCENGTSINNRELQ